MDYFSGMTRGVVRYRDFIHALNQNRAESRKLLSTEYWEKSPNRSEWYY